jgi:hypothetical protein
MCPVNRENNEKCLYSQQVFSVSTNMTDTQIQKMYPVSHPTANGVAIVRNRSSLILPYNPSYCTSTTV